MENFALIAIVENLRPAMADFVVRRVVQHNPNGFIFQTRSAKFPALKIVVEPQNPALYPSEARPPGETTGTDFLMVLRKHLTSAELVSLFKPLSERIVEFVFKTAVPTKELETMSLVVELLPNAPNIILLDAERHVLCSFLPITPQHGIGEYETYCYPKTWTCRMSWTQPLTILMMFELSPIPSPGSYHGLRVLARCWPAKSSTAKKRTITR